MVALNSQGMQDEIKVKKDLLYRGDVNLLCFISSLISCAILSTGLSVSLINHKQRIEMNVIQCMLST